MFGATLLVNGGSSVLIAAIIFDPWLLLTTFWGTYMENRMLYIINHSSMNQCFDEVDNHHDLKNALQTIIIGVNNINICLWTMAAMSLSAGLVIDIICTSIREFEYCLRMDLNEGQSCWNKWFCCITQTVQAVDEAMDEALEDAGIIAEEKEDPVLRTNLSHSTRI